MDFEAIVNYRRSVRVYTNEPIDTEKVKKCIELATLAPNSSNMQLWEFVHVVSPAIISQLAEACLNQNAAKTAQQLLVVVVRKDLWSKRAKQNLEFASNQFDDKADERTQKRQKGIIQYYDKLMPFLYSSFLGVLGGFRKLIVSVVGIFRPIARQVSEADMRVVAHKSAALAAQTFMLAMAAQKYDTCPMEGFDSYKVKKILGLPYSAEINMIISCGIRNTEKGIYGERFRVPFEEVYSQK